MKCAKCQKCFSELRKPLVISCGHSFCSLCFEEKTIVQCPTCGESGKIIMNFALYEEVIKNKNNHIEKYLKICLFGSTHVGKSSLIKRIVDNDFQEFVNPTIGIDFKYQDIEVGNAYYRFQFWDSAGQQKYRSMVPQNLKNSDIIFLVYDLSESSSENLLEDWFKEIQNYVQHSNIIVIGNKTDEYKQKEKDSKFQSMTLSERNYIQKKQFKMFKTSCKTGENIKQLMEYVVDLSKIIKGKPKSVVLSKIQVQEKKQTSKKNNNGGCYC